MEILLDDQKINGTRGKYRFGFSFKAPVSCLEKASRGEAELPRSVLITNQQYVISFDLLRLKIFCVRGSD